MPLIGDPLDSGNGLTLGTVKTALQELGYATDTESAQNEAVNSAVRRVSGVHRWPWQEVHTASCTLSVGEYEVEGLPVNMLHIDSVRLESGTYYSEPQWDQPQNVRRELHLYRDNGCPLTWAYHAANVIVNPRADLEYIVTIDYVMVPAKLTDDADLLPLPDSYDDIVKWASAAHLAYRERDWNAYNAADGKYAQLMQEAWAETGLRQRQNATHVARSGAWDRAATLGPRGV